MNDKPTYTNQELQRQLCDLVGLDYNGMKHLTITTDVHGMVEVEAKYYVVTYPEQAEPF